MEAIETYVFLDLETTGLPHCEFNKTRITELSMVAVKRKHILEGAGRSPRVKHKLTLCFNPGKMIDPISTEITGLCNDLLEYESYFNLDSLKTINSFLSLLKKPLCLVAHNGHKFDFPILQNHLVKLKSGLPTDIMCADSWFCFYDIMGPTRNNSVLVTKEETQTDSGHTMQDNYKSLYGSGERHTDGIELSSKEIVNEQRLMQIENESTPKCRKRGIAPTTCRSSKVRRKLPWDTNPKPKESYKLEEVYKRTVGSLNMNAHQAENDCIMALEIAVAFKDKFVKWVDRNCYLFTECEPMTIGIPL